LQKLGGNTVTLTGANTQTGLTTVAEGTLRVTPAGSVGSGTIFVAPSAAFVMEGYSDFSVAKVAANSLLLGDEAPELDFQPYFWTEQFGYALKACGNLPVSGIPQYIDGDVASEPSLMRWQNPDGTGTAVSVNYRIPIPKLRALSRQAPSAENQQA
jgi:autotransporter-associated beta strand protein